MWARRAFRDGILAQQLTQEITVGWTRWVMRLMKKAMGPNNDEGNIRSIDTGLRLV